MFSKIARLVLLILLLSSCATDEDPAKSLTEPKFDRPTEYSTETPMPFDEFRLSESEFVEMQTKELAYFRNCMSDAGIGPERYSLNGDYVVPADVPSLPLWGGKLGTLTMRHAREFGYHAGPGDPISGASGYYIKTWNIQMTVLAPGSEPPAEKDEDAVANTYSNCGNRLPAAAREQPPDITRLEADLVNRSFSDRRVANAVDEWSACMESKGYSFDELDKASLQFSLVFKISKKEIETATADVTCTEQTRWSDYFYTVLADYQRQAINQDPDLFNDYERALQRRLDTFVEMAV